MSFATFTDAYLLPADKRHDRLSRIFVYLSLAATLAGLAAATMTLLYGYADLAIAIYMAALTLPMALPLLRFTGKVIPAGNYLAANLFLQTIFFAASLTSSVAPPWWRILSKSAVDGCPRLTCNFLRATWILSSTGPSKRIL